MSVAGEDVTIVCWFWHVTCLTCMQHTVDEHVPVPLTIHHRPLSATFAFVDDGSAIPRRHCHSPPQQDLHCGSHGEGGVRVCIDHDHHAERPQGGAMPQCRTGAQCCRCAPSTSSAASS